MTSWGYMSNVAFSELEVCDLTAGTTFTGGTAGTIADDPISKLFRVGNAGGFRFRGKVASTRLVVLYSTGQEEHWPDSGDSQDDEFLYFGDNRTPNVDLLDTPHGGNRLLRRAFDSAATPEQRATVPIFVFMRKTGRGRDAELVGFAVPKMVRKSGEPGLIEVQHFDPEGPIRNYEAAFSLLPTKNWPRNNFDNFLGTTTSDFLRFAPVEFQDWIAMQDSPTQDAPSNHMELDIRPDASMLDVFENITYTPWFALGELVDNSISSFMELREASPETMRSKTLIIKISWDAAQKIIRVEDTAGGIKLGEDGWDRVLKVGKKKANAKHLSVFGYGLKAAGLWWSPKLTVESKVEGESVSRTATIDRNNLSPTNKVPLVENAAPVSDHYTRVTLTGLNKNRSIPIGGAVSRIQDYLASMYRVYLRGDSEKYQDDKGNPWLHIKVQNTWLKPPKQELLEQPYWPTTNGPEENSKPIHWKTPVMNFTITNPDTGDTKNISGWVGLLKIGKPNDAGFLMLFRGKGIVGVGQGVGTNTDLYRPASIVGSGNTNRRQRMVGEFDISEFGKSVTTDAIDWSEQEESDFLKQLEAKLKDPAFNIWAMAENWRPTKLIELAPNATATYDNAAGDAVEAVEKETRRPGSVLNPDTAQPTPAKPNEDTSTIFVDQELAFEKTFEVSGTNFKFIGSLSGLNFPWLSVFEDNGTWIIQVNQDHPFMRSFAWVPGHDPKSLYRLAMSIALAEINADPAGQRNYINELLDGPLGSTHWGDDL